MNSIVRLGTALTAASVAAPAALAAYLCLTVAGPLNGLSVVLAVAWLVGLLHLIVFGIPLFVLLNRRGLLGWARIGVSGFLAGALPSGLLGVPSYQSGYSSGGNWHGRYVDFYLDGEPTRYAWFAHLEGSLLWGVFGVAAALVFWRVWVALGPPPAAGPDAGP